MDRAEIQSCPPSLSPRVSHPERSRTRTPELNEGSLKHKRALSEKRPAVQDCALAHALERRERAESAAGRGSA